VNTMQANLRLGKILEHLNPSQSTLESNLTAGRKIKSKPVRVVVTGAAGQIGYALLPLIANGTMFGLSRRVILHLLEVEVAKKSLDGVVMELIDGAYPLLVDIVATTDVAVAFKDVDAAVLVGAFPRKQGMERGDLLAKNAAIFKEQGLALEKYASKSVKILVVGNPANTNCLIARQFAPSIPDKNWSALTRLDHHRAIAQIAQKTNSPVETVKNAIIWGNHSATQYPDANHARIYPLDGQSSYSVAKVVDRKYLEGPFVTTVQQRGAAVISARGMSSAMSAAQAITMHMRDWWMNTTVGEWASMGVISDGSYGVPKGLVFSFPVTIQNGTYQIVKGLDFDDFGKEKIRITTEELLTERKIAFEILGIKV